MKFPPPNPMVQCPYHGRHVGWREVPDAPGAETNCWICRYSGREAWGARCHAQCPLRAPVLEQDAAPLVNTYAGGF